MATVTLGTNYDIIIKETGSKTQIRIPWLPDKIIEEGTETRTMSYEILDLGEVVVPNGRNLRKVSWSSKFPGSNNKNLPFLRGTWKAPKEYQKQLESWRKNGTELKLTVACTRIDFKVILSNFVILHEGGAGDMAYDIEFMEPGELKVSKTKKSKKTGKKSGSNSKTKTKTYTVKKGDSLWKISKKYLGKGSRWKEIYKLNKSTIEKAAKKHKRKNSKNGKYIYPGTKLKLPAK